MSLASQSSTAPVLVHTESSKAWGGQEIRIYTELMELRKRGWAVMLFAPPDSEIFRRSVAGKIDVMSVSFCNSFDIGSIVRVRRFLMRHRCDVLVTHSSIDSWVTGFALFGMVQRPILVRTRHLSTPIKNLLSYRWFPDMICTTSGSIRDLFLERGIDSSRVVSIPTGVDLDRFCSSPASGLEKAKLRKKLGLPVDRPLVGGVFVVRTWKGIFDFVKIAAAVPEADFVVAGTGPSLWSMEKLAAELGVSARLHFLGHVEKVEEVYWALDIFLFPSTGHEGVPQSLLQAVACGLPVVASRLPSIEEVMPSNFLKPPGDIGAFSLTIKKILSDPSLASGVVESIRGEILSRYDQSLMLRRIDEFYRSLIRHST